MLGEALTAEDDAAVLQELEQLEGKEAQAEASELPAVPKVIWLHTLCMRKWHLLPLIAFWVQDAALNTIECVETAHAALSIDRAVVGCYLLRLSSLICPFVNACLDSPEHMQICCSSLCLLCCLQAELCRRRALQLSKEKTKLTGRCLHLPSVMSGMSPAGRDGAGRCTAALERGGQAA